MLVPKLRFSEFTDEWKPTILYDMFDTITDFVAAGSFADLAENVKYNNNKDYAQLIRTIDIKNKFKNKDFVYINEKAYDFLWRVNLDKDAVILPNIGANIGERYFIDSKKLPYLKSALGPNAILLRSSINNQKYLYNLFNTRTFEIQLKNIVGASGQPKFNKTELKKFIFNICSISEQNKIADFIALIDKKIELQSQKIEALKLYKKGLIHTIGKDRNNWEKYKIKDIFNITRGVVIPKNKLSETKKDGYLYPVYSSQTTNNGILGYDKTFAYDGKYLTWTTDGANAGKVFYRNGKFKCTNVCGILYENNIKYTNQLVADLLNYETPKHVSYVGNPKLMNNVIAEIEINLPNLEVQKELSLILETIDKKLNNELLKYNYINVLKKGLMQKMFV